MTDDRFATEEGGGGVQSLDGAISDFFFQDGQYGCSICVKIMFDDPQNYPQFPEGTYTQWYPMGDQFHALDNGVRVDGPAKWDRRQDAGRLLYALGQVPGVNEAVPADWTKEDANSWKGMRLHWERESYDRKSYAKDANGNRIPDPDRPGKDLLVDKTFSVMLPKSLLDTQLTISANGAVGVDVQSLNLSGEQVTALSQVAKDAATGAKFIEGVVAYDASLMAGTPLAAAITKDAEGVRVALAAEVI